MSFIIKKVLQEQGKTTKNQIFIGVELILELTLFVSLP